MILGKTVRKIMEHETPFVIQIGPPLITEERFTTHRFKAFLLDSILTEVLYCDIHTDCWHPTRKILTALGKLQDQWYLVQLTSDDRSFEDVRIIQVQYQLIGKISEIFGIVSKER